MCNVDSKLAAEKIPWCVVIGFWVGSFSIIIGILYWWQDDLDAKYDNAYGDIFAATLYSSLRWAMLEGVAAFLAFFRTHYVCNLFIRLTNRLFKSPRFLIGVMFSLLDCMLLVITYYALIYLASSLGSGLNNFTLFALILLVVVLFPSLITAGLLMSCKHAWASAQGYGMPK